MSACFTDRVGGVDLSLDGGFEVSDKFNIYSKA